MTIFPPTDLNLIVELLYSIGLKDIITAMLVGELLSVVVVKQVGTGVSHMGYVKNFFWLFK